MLSSPSNKERISKRIPWIDFVKGAAIILVVLHHVLLGLHTDGLLTGWLATYPTWPWIDGVMYAFMYLSGMMSTNKYYTKPYYRNKAHNCLDMSLLGILLYTVFWQVASHGNTGIVIGHLWFLLYLASFTALCGIFHNKQHTVNLLITLAVVSLFWHTLEFLPQSAEQQRCTIMLIWFTLGQLYSIKPTLPNNDVSPIAYLPLYSLLVGWWLGQGLEEYAFTAIWRGLLILLLLGLLNILCQARMLKSWLHHGICYLGRYSLMIYFWHIMAAWGFRHVLTLVTVNQYTIIALTLPLAIVASLFAGQVIKYGHERFRPAYKKNSPQAR